MADVAWHDESFTVALMERLAAVLQGGRAIAVLAHAVRTGADTAEQACGGRPLACSSGCPHCCVLNVAILQPEGLVIADWLRERLMPEEFEELRTRLAVHSNWGRWMDDEERIARQAVCPFLDEAGSCSIHPVRPLACRGIASLDRDCCAAAFDPIINEHDRTVPADLLRRAAYDAAFTALALALRQQGYDDRSIELGAGVLAFLEHPEYGEQLLCGQPLPRSLWG